MPLWTLEELQDARKTVYDGMSSEAYAEYTEEEVKERFALYGGVPRWVLERPRVGTNKWSTSEAQLETSLADVTMEELLKVFRAATYIDIPKQNLTSILVHFVPGPNLHDPPKCRFASEAIRLRLVDALLDRQNFGAAGFINAVRQIPELGGYRGYTLEHNVHRSLPKGPKVQLRRLGAKSNTSEFEFAQPPRLDTASAAI